MRSLKLAEILQGPGARTKTCKKCDARLFENEGDYCPYCEADALTEERMAAEAAEHHAAVRRDLAAYRQSTQPFLEQLDVPSQYQNVRMPQFRPEVTNWQGSPWSLLFVGPVGCGKTCAGTAIFGKVAIELRHSRKEVDWVSAPVIMHMLRKEFRDQAESSALDRLLSVRLLLLDDLGAERPTDWALETIRVLLMHRHQHDLPTIVTANASDQAELEKRYPREISRLNAGLVVPITGKDRRLKSA